MYSEQIEQIAKDIGTEVEKMIRQSAEEGYDYLVETFPEYTKKDDMVFKGTIRFQKFKGDSGLEYFKKHGYRIYDLKAVREYLKKIEGGIINE